ncbi:MAG TPA: serine/threonine-protein kinase, partial [Polyangia bacterium]|nr:serine/threonine-protein kinase [Polyangia bacterium]
MTDPQDTGGASGSGRVGLVGKTLGRYRISAELGRGGMATVYRAFDPQLARDVAIKVMHGAFTGRDDIERRFRREAQAVAALKHESIVDVFDFAPGGDGEPAYIVSELVEGPTLRQLLERSGGKIVPEVAVPIAARVAAALGAAHARGIVHRDVKPDNVMIDLGDGKKAGARVLLTDFGIARMIEDDTMTATGSILGSPSYMSPEQARSGTVGPGSDVFSLGAMLYQMVVGRTPFQGKDPLTVIAALVSGEFLRPGQVDARVGPELEAVILRCFKRRPEERYADGNAVGAALRELAAATAPASALGDEGAALKAFHDDRAAFERRIGGAVADGAVERARANVRKGELTKALAQINRALAYAPGHRGAEAVLATISSRRRWAKTAVVVATLGLAGGAAAGVRALVHAHP